MTSQEQVDYYTILGLQPPRRLDDSSYTNEALKAAYRRALLSNHPDKVPRQHIATDNARVTYSNGRPTVDQIAKAYETLANPISRKEYHETLLERKHANVLDNTDRTKVNPGLDTFDLEELEYHDSLHAWAKPCRCGGTYQVKENQLEGAGSDGEVIVGCNGCSLYIKVAFGILDE